MLLVDHVRYDNSVFVVSDVATFQDESDIRALFVVRLDVAIELAHQVIAAWDLAFVKYRLVHSVVAVVVSDCHVLSHL